MTYAHLLRVEPEIHRARQPGDIDYFDEVIKALTNAGHPAPTNWTADPDLAQARNGAPLLQRMAINAYWRVTLINVPPEYHETSRNLRTYLDDADWPDGYYLNCWLTVIAPCIVKLGL